MSLVSLADVLKVLCDEGAIRSMSPVAKVKPTHGSCCTCQDCGYEYDSCVCETNALLEKLNAIEKFDARSV